MLIKFLSLSNPLEQCSDPFPVGINKDHTVWLDGAGPPPWYIFILTNSHPTVILIVSIKFFLGIIILTVILLNVIMLSVIILTVVMLTVVMLTVIMLTIVMLTIVMLTIVMLTVILLTVIILMSLC